MTAGSAGPDLALERVWRDDWGRLLGGLIARTGRADLAEDALAEAFAEAAAQWVAEVPERPAAWIATVARRRVLDAIRAEAMLQSRAHLIAEPDTAPEHDAEELPGDDRDDRVPLSPPSGRSPRS